MRDALRKALAGLKLLANAGGLLALLLGATGNVSRIDCLSDGTNWTLGVIRR